MIQKQLKYYLSICCIIYAVSIQAQPFQQDNFGATIGLTFNFGTHINRIGAQFQGYYQKDFVQINLGIRSFYNFTSFGPKIKRPELQTTTGIVLGYGNRDSTYNNFLHPVSNQTYRNYSVGYSYNFYFEKQTKQRSGTIGLSFGDVEFIVENDAFSFQGKDRYRTGGLLLSYRIDETRVAITSTLWHGNTHGDKVKRIKDAPNYPSRHGYKDFSAAKFGKFSNGMLALQVQQVLPYAQTVQISTGIDSEKVRHFFQNKLVHDLLFFPKEWEQFHNPHYPMLDENGMPYLFLPDQVSRKDRYYFDVGLNSGMFY